MYGVLDDTFCGNILGVGCEFSHVGFGDFWKGFLGLCGVDEKIEFMGSLPTLSRTGQHCNGPDSTPIYYSPLPSQRPGEE